MQIVVAALSGGVFATLAAAGTLVLHRAWISRIVSFAVGAYLGRSSSSCCRTRSRRATRRTGMATVLAVSRFFALEKLVLWRPAHGRAHEDDETSPSTSTRCIAHGADQGRSGLMILIGTSVHNFLRRRRHRGVVSSRNVDSAWRRRSHRGARGAAAGRRFRRLVIRATRSRALLYNVVGRARDAGRRDWRLLRAREDEQALPIALAVAASSLLYVAVADLIPSCTAAGAARNREAASAHRLGIAVSRSATWGGPRAMQGCQSGGHSHCES
jgi:zinc and cadmium transporter